MKVLVVTNDFPPRIGGINYYVAHLMRRFPAGEVTIFASSWPGAAEHDAAYPHQVIRWEGSNMLPRPAVRRRVIEVVRSEDPDVVLFGATFPLGLIGPRILWETGVPFAGFTHGVEVGAARAARPLLRRIGAHASLLTAVSDWCRRIMLPVVGPGPRFELLPPGIDAGLFHPGVETAEVRGRLGLDGGPVIACVSRLVQRKGQDMVIRALPRIAAEFPGVRFLVVGRGPDEKRLRALARRHRVERHVVFAGEIPYEGLPAVFRVGDVFAMPCRSRWAGFDVEALGAVYHQANAVGRPCVGGTSGGAPEAVRDGETGLVVDGQSVAAVGDAILALLRDPERARAMGHAGAEWVHRDLTWDAVGARLRGLVSDTVGAR